MRKSINPMFGLKIRSEASSGSAPSLIVLLSLRQLFLARCTPALLASASPVVPSSDRGPLSVNFFLRMWRITPGLGRPSQGKLLTSQVGQIR